MDKVTFVRSASAKVVMQETMQEDHWGKIIQAERMIREKEDAYCSQEEAVLS